MVLAMVVVSLLTAAIGSFFLVPLWRPIVVPLGAYRVEVTSGVVEARNVVRLRFPLPVYLVQTWSVRIGRGEWIVALARQEVGS
jgi:hypothetical protein